MSPLIILACIFFFVLLVMKKRNSNRRTKKLPPGPPGLPIVGNLHQLGSLPHRTLYQFSRKYGPLIYVKFGSVPTVVASTPETVREVLKTHDLDCCTRPHLAGPERLTYKFTDLVFSPYNEYWRELRKICTLELYSTKRVQSFRYIREEEISSLLDFMNQSALSETPVNLSNRLLSLSASVICRLAFGIGLGGSKISNKYEEVVTEAMEVLGSFSAADFFPYVGWIIDRLSGLHKQREKIFHHLDSFYEHAIKYNLENKSQEGKEDIVEVLLKIEREQAGSGAFRLTRNHIKGILMNILLAGIDTSAQTITWAMTRLNKNPRAMKKVQAEIRDHIGSKGKITEEDTEQLEYLKMVIKETLRLHPPAALLVPREAMSEFQINGYDIPAKTRIQVNIWALGHNPEVWKDPEEFIPERFMDNQIDYKGQNFELLPFGSGRRMCPGMNMGLALVHLTLANFLYRFNWKLPEGMKEEDVNLEETYGLTTPKKIPLVLVPVKTEWT